MAITTPKSYVPRTKRKEAQAARYETLTKLLYKNPMTVNELAKKFKVTPVAVHYWLRWLEFCGVRLYKGQKRVRRGSPGVQVATTYET